MPTFKVELYARSDFDPLPVILSLAEIFGLSTREIFGFGTHFPEIFGLGTHALERSLTLKHTHTRAHERSLILKCTQRAPG